jgi:hypothetical protein
MKKIIYDRVEKMEKNFMSKYNLKIFIIKFINKKIHIQFKIAPVN